MRKIAMFPILVLLVATQLGAEEAVTPSEQSAVVDAVSGSLVRVEYTLQFDKGEAPTGGGPCPNCGGYHDGGSDVYIDQERPLETAGFLVSPKRVVAPDNIIHPRFIKRIDVRFGDQLVEARPFARAIGQSALFLELDQPLSDAKPLVFDPAKKRPYLAVTYGFEDGAWTINAEPLGMAISVTENGRRFIPITGRCLITDKEGTPVGISMSDRLPVDDSWRGSPLNWAVLPAEEMSKRLEALREASDKSLLRVTLNFRSPKKKAEQYRSYGYHSEDEKAAVREVKGALVDERTVLVLVKLDPNVTARLERITVHPDEGEPVPAKFAYTLTDYGCFLVTLEKPLEGAVAFSSQDILESRNKLLLSAEIRIQGEKRIPYYGHKRIPSYEIGWRRNIYPHVPGFTPNLFLFDSDGALLIIPVARREKVSLKERWDSERAVAVPVVLMVDVLSDLAKHTDPSNVPLSEEEENRLAWMGVELQALNKELARANNVSDLTGDGQTGALVSYVYSDSPASQADIEVGYILLRLHVEGQPKPLEVRLESDRYGFREFQWDQLDMMPEEYLERIPGPWPSAENNFTRALTDIGLEKKYTAEFFHDGEVIRKEFLITRGPPHYNSAPRHKSKALGMTVRDLTYEVRRYFQKKPDDAGVIVSKIESGSKASVGGIKPFEIITHVNDSPVANVGDFEKLIADQEELRLSVQRMTRTRLVKIKMATSGGVKVEEETESE